MFVLGIEKVTIFRLRRLLAGKLHQSKQLSCPEAKISFAGSTNLTDNSACAARFVMQEGHK
jgi:hypothetical protein